VKLTENAFRDVNIAYANELSMICEDVDVDVWELITLANRHPRVNILQPGCGVGGHCIAVDPWFIVNAAPERARLIRSAREVNDSKPRFVLEQVREHLERTGGRKIACLGLSFKANIDDLRESPALEIVRELAKSGMVEEIIAVEPHIESLPAVLQEFGESVRLESDLKQALGDADLVLLLVDHRVFRDAAELLLARPLIDTRGVTAGLRS
jgi:UDP-N-acetyl-D-mannosaminuronic acid dehydrogenase